MQRCGGVSGTAGAALRRIALERFREIAWKGPDAVLTRPMTPAKLTIPFFVVGALAAHGTPAQGQAVARGADVAVAVAIVPGVASSLPADGGSTVLGTLTATRAMGRRWIRVVEAPTPAPPGTSAPVSEPPVVRIAEVERASAHGPVSLLRFTTSVLY